MRQLRALTPKLVALTLLFVVALISGRAKADVTIFDNDGWSVYTNGLIAAHYQLQMGDGDPSPAPGIGVLAGGKLLTTGSEDTTSGSKKVFLSRFRSGFVGTQLGIGINRRISDGVHVESLIAVSLQDISNNRGQNGAKEGDFREAWANVVTPYGSFKFGRMFSIFGSASAQVVLMAYRYGVGNPCAISSSTIACGSVGAGPLYAGFDAQMRYISPRVAGFQLQVALVDPTEFNANILYTLTPSPRVDGEINYDATFGPAHLRAYGQFISDRPVLNDTATMTLKTLNTWGAMGAAILDIGGLSLGGGGWEGRGIGTRVPLEAEDPAYPSAVDQLGNPRLFRGFFGNASYDFHGTALTVGGGALYVQPTTDDETETAFSILKQNQEFHAVLTHKIDTVVLVAEYMRWQSQWHYGEVQNFNFMGVGANYFW
jgi:Gram-negative porin